MTSKKRGGTKYSDAFKIQLFQESRAAGATVPMVSKRHGVPTSRLYTWRADVRFEPKQEDEAGFSAIEVIEEAKSPVPVERSGRDWQIGIALENGCKLSSNAGVDARLILKLAKGLAA